MKAVCRMGLDQGLKLIMVFRAVECRTKPVRGLRCEGWEFRINWI